MKEKELFQDLLVRFFDGKLTQEEEVMLLKFLKEDENNFKELLEIRDIWDSAEANLTTKEDETEEALLNLNKKIFGRKNIFSSPFIRIAATLIILLGFSFLFFFLGNKSIIYHSDNNQITYNEIIVPKGQKSQITLSDSTKIWLNGNSVLRYPSQFATGRRDVELEGEAYLEVAKDKERPFFVKTSELTIKVLGTKFNIKAYQGDKTIETTLIEGAVKILPTKSTMRLQETLLKPNEKATFDREGKSLILVDLAFSGERKQIEVNQLQTKKSIEAEVEPIISWKDDKLIFNDETLVEIALKMERWFGVDVKFDSSNKKLNSYRYTGKFVYNESIERVMEVISVTTPLYYEINQNTLIIRPK